MDENQNWTKHNKDYWDKVAEKYNNSYNDNWSELENKFIAQKLTFISQTKTVKILDLGCGTGLGYQLCSQSNPEIDYTGIDISIEMLEVLKKKYPNVQTYQTAMSNLQTFNTQTFDGVISVFTAFSYSDNIPKTISEIARVLKADGKIIISVISRFSLRRILELKFDRKEKYKTRGIFSTGFSYSWVFSKKEIIELLKSEFVNVEVIGYNPFGGIPIISKYPKLWKLNLFIAKIFPNLSHELIISATKKTTINV